MYYFNGHDDVLPSALINVSSTYTYGHNEWYSPATINLIAWMNRVALEVYNMEIFDFNIPFRFTRPLEQKNEV